MCQISCFNVRIQFFFLPQHFILFLTFEHSNFFMPLNILQIKFFYVAKNKKIKKKIKRKKKWKLKFKTPRNFMHFHQTILLFERKYEKFEIELKNIKKYYYCVNGSWRLLNRLPVKSILFIVTIDRRAEVFIDICNRHNSMFTQNWKISPVEIKKRASN